VSERFDLSRYRMGPEERKALRKEPAQPALSEAAQAVAEKYGWSWKRRMENTASRQAATDRQLRYVAVLARLNPVEAAELLPFLDEVVAADLNLPITEKFSGPPALVGVLGLSLGAGQRANFRLTKADVQFFIMRAPRE